MCFESFELNRNVVIIHYIHWKIQLETNISHERMKTCSGFTLTILKRNYSFYQPLQKWNIEQMPIHMKYLLKICQYKLNFYVAHISGKYKLEIDERIGIKY